MQQAPFCGAAHSTQRDSQGCDRNESDVIVCTWDVHMQSQTFHHALYTVTRPFELPEITVPTDLTDPQLNSD